MRKAIRSSFTKPRNIYTETTEKSFLEVMGKGKREIKEFLDELSKEK